MVGKKKQLFKEFVFEMIYILKIGKFEKNVFYRQFVFYKIDQKFFFYRQYMYIVDLRIENLVVGFN